MHRREYLSAVGATTAVALAGCAGTGSSSNDSNGGSNDNDESSDDGGSTSNGGGATTTTAELPEVEVGAAGGGSTGVLLEIAVGEEFDINHGVDISPVRAAPPQVFQQIANHAVEVAMFGVQATAAARREGKNISIYGPWLANHNSLVVLPDSEVESWEDLRGERIGILPPSSAQYNHAQIRVSQLGMDLEDDFDLRTGGPGAIHSLNKKGETAAHLGFVPPSVNALVNEEFREVEYFPEILTEAFGRNLHYTGLAGWDGFLNENRDAAIGIRNALLDAANLLNEQPQEILSTYRESSGYQSQAEVEFAADRTPPLYPTEWNDDARADIIDQLKRSKELGAIAEDAPTEVVANID
jgi:ABC-type nitrate/sulfonate/bicarbonate transport system substrate-binding protein